MVGGSSVFSVLKEITLILLTGFDQLACESVYRLTSQHPLVVNTYKQIQDLVFFNTLTPFCKRKRNSLHICTLTTHPNV